MHIHMKLILKIDKSKHFLKVATSISLDVCELNGLITPKEDNSILKPIRNHALVLLPNSVC
jgi:hypothetical protein